MPLYTWTFVINVHGEENYSKLMLNNRLILRSINTAQTVAGFFCAAPVMRKFTAARTSPENGNYVTEGAGLSVLNWNDYL